MRLAQISHFLLHVPASKTRERAGQLQTCLAVVIGVFFGLIMGMTAIVTLLRSDIASKPGMLLPKVLILLTFIILSVFLFTRRSDSEEEEKS
jgi:cytochrome bd-type quinol oxidase subunit 2